MLKKILYVLLFLVFVYLILCVAGPARLDATISKTLNAKSNSVYAQIGELRKWRTWSTWSVKDTTTTYEYGKKTNGVGGTYSWNSKKSGNGTMTIVSDEPGNSVGYDLSFKGWDDTSDVKISLKPNGDKTDVVWSMKARKDMPFFMRGVMLIMNMNNSLKKDFDASLTNIEKHLQSSPDEMLMNGFNIVKTKFPAQDYLGKRSVVKFQDMQNYFATNFEQIAKAAGPSISGAPVGIYWKYDEKAMNADMAAAMPVSKFNNTTPFTIFSVPDGKQFELNFYGNYDAMMPAYQTLDSVIKMNGYSNPVMVVEEYITDPMTEKDTAKWHTKIHMIVE